MENYKTYTAKDEDTRNKLILSFIVGVLVGFGGFYAWSNNSLNFLKNKTNTETVKIEKESEKNIINSYSLNKIEVADQPTYNKVFISSLTLEATGWVAIYEDREGVPGNILGAQLFDAGDYNYGQVDLLREMTAGKTYYAILHFDDGDRKFDYQKDLPIGQELGNFIMATFTTI